MTSALVAAIDVGGTKLAGVLLDRDGIRYLARRATPGPPGAADPGSTALRSLAADLADRAEGTVAAVGVGFCEYVHRGRLTSTEVIAWSEQPADWLSAVFPGAAVTVESDVRCGLLAERRLGAARDLDSAAFVSWGTGLSCALLVAGRVWPGERGRAIALGELPGPDGGNLESYASGAGMAARLATATGRPPGPARDLLDAARSGAEPAAGIARSAGAALAGALAALVHLVDPARIVLGGGLGAAPDTVAHRALAERWAVLGAPVPLAISPLGRDGQLLGAAVAAGWPDRR